MRVFFCMIAAVHWQAAIAAIKQNIQHKVVGYAHEHIAPNNDVGHMMYLLSDVKMSTLYNNI